MKIDKKKLEELKTRLLILKEKDIQFKDYIFKNSQDTCLKLFSFDTEKHIYDPDSSLLAWKYYLKVYEDLLSLTDEDEKSLFNEDYTTKCDEKKFWLRKGKYERIVGTFCYSNDGKALLDNSECNV